MGSERLSRSSGRRPRKFSVKLAKPSILPAPGQGGGSEAGDVGTCPEFTTQEHKTCLPPGSSRTPLGARAAVSRPLTGGSGIRGTEFESQLCHSEQQCGLGQSYSPSLCFRLLICKTGPLPTSRMLAGLKDQCLAFSWHSKSVCSLPFS